MTNEERQLVIDYIENDPEFRFYFKVDHEDELRELLIKRHYDTVNFKWYALKNEWNKKWKELTNLLK